LTARRCGIAGTRGGAPGDNPPVAEPGGVVRAIALPRVAAVVVVVGVATAAAALAAAPVRERHFQRIGPERGLHAGEIAAIHQDRTGFLWIGSREGLFLYDGYEVRSFEHDADDPSSLSDNGIRAILEDREGRLWIGTRSGGLDMLDRATWRFEHHRHDPAVATSLPNNAVFALLQDRGGALWVGTQGGLSRYDPATGRFETVAVAGWVIDLLEDRDGDLWAAMFGEGIFRRRAGRSDFEPVEVVDAPPHYRALRSRCLAQDADGTIWAGVAGGLLRLDVADGKFRTVDIPIGPEGPSGLPTASDLAVASDGTLWIATPGGGLVAMNPRTRSGRRYANRFGVDTSLSSDNVQCLHLGHDGTLWIGTGQGTLDQLRPDPELFSVVGGGRPGDEFGFGNDVFEDASERLWVSSFGAGLQIFDPDGTFVTTWPTGPVSDTGERTFVTLAAAADGGAWAGTTLGLVRLSADLRAASWWRADPSDPGSLGPGYVQAVLERRDGTVWVGTGGGGLYRMRSDGTGFDAFRHDDRYPDGLSDDTITVLAEDRGRALWIGTASGGVSVLPPGAERPRPLRSESPDAAILARQSVSSVTEDRAGRVWIGTLGGGLFRVDRDGAGVAVTRLGGAEGLVNENVASVLEDDDGSLWIATRRGLARFDPDGGAFSTLGLEDGLPTSNFSTGSAWAGRRSLFFGTRKGVVVVRRGTPFPAPVPSPTTLTSLRTLHGPVEAERPVPEVRRVSIRYGEVLFVDYAVLDFRAPDRHRFAYSIGGRNREWVDVGNRRSLTFTDLDPGEHVLRVRGRNADGVWSETPAPLVVEVVPPFWMTWWFRGLLAVAVVAVAWTWVHVRLTALERRNRELEALQRDREAALAQARTSERALQGAYERLRGLTRRLEDAKEDERRRIARELHDEMGQALSAVKMNLKAIGRASADGAAEARVGDALTLVNGIIEQVRTLSLDLRPPLIDELGLVAALRGYAEGHAIRSGVDIAVEANAEAVDIPAEIGITAFRIVQESIHNALRHAVAARVDVSVRRDPGRLTLTVRDDGRGFDLAEALERASAGRHLGLLGMRERIEALGGRFEIETSPRLGTVVHASIPLDDGEDMP